jgi:hypothetical protein
MHPDDEVREGLTAGGFGRVETEVYEIPPDPVDRFLYSGKHRPELYLNQESLRHGERPRRPRFMERPGALDPRRPR